MPYHLILQRRSILLIDQNDIELFSVFGAAMDDSVSAFIVGTCRTLPKPNTNVYKSAHLRYSEESECYCIVCGSCGEIFIQPLQPCFGDIDYLMVISDCRVFADEKRVLPYEFRHIDHPIRSLLMEPYHDYPAFVRFRILGKMSYDWDRKTLEFDQDNTCEFFDIGDLDEMNSNDKNFVRVGPPIRGFIIEMGSVSYDLVGSLWCPQWLNVAKKWPNRQRKYGWPTTTIIQEVVQNGCYVVRATHPECRNDTRQWRLSFSVAEVILLQSWTNVQQIVYHMLRFFSKRELIVTDCPTKDEVICTYHIKTLMLWSCEEKSTDWWNSSSVIKLCCNLLKILQHWLKVTRCPNYFIPQANLFHGHFIRKNVEENIDKLIYYSDFDILSFWFVENYMQPSFLYVLDEKCIHDVLSRDYMLKTLEAKKASYPKSIELYFSTRFWFVAILTAESKPEELHIGYLDIWGYNLKLVSNILHAAEYESCYWFYESMLLILHAAYLLGCRKVDYWFKAFLDIIADVLTKPIRYKSKHHVFSRPLKTHDDEGL